MRTAFSLVLVLLAFTANAKQTESYTCYGDDNGDDWVLTVSFKGAKPSAVLRDNDSYSNFNYFGSDKGIINFIEAKGDPHSYALIDFTPATKSSRATAVYYDEHVGPGDGIAFTCQKN